MQHVIIVSDIFGRCAGLARLLQDLDATDLQIQLIDPYQGQPQGFANETQAYAAYAEQCGHDAYAVLVEQALQGAPQPVALAIGFSAGASALWRALANTASCAPLKQAVLFYPGQIHHHLALKPAVPTQVIFGDKEPHFAVAAICSQLQQKPAVGAVATAFGHGFMNPASSAFNEVGYQHYLAQLQAMLAAG